MAEIKPSEEAAARLEELIVRENRNENECRPYLRYIIRDLVKGIPADYNFRIREEVIGNTGKLDYIIIANMQRFGESSRQAFVWELKAAQCFIYEYDSDNRVKPTEDFIDAENQLLHYTYEIQKNGLLREQHNIDKPENVCLGGIIIGRNNRKVKNHEKYDHQRKEELFKTAKESRNLMYRDKITFMTWDDVVQNIRNKQVINRDITSGEILETPSRMFQPALTSFLDSEQGNK